MTNVVTINNPFILTNIEELVEFAMSHPHEELRLLDEARRNAGHAVALSVAHDIGLRTSNDFLIAGLLSLCTLIGGPLNLWVLFREIGRIRRRSTTPSVLIRLHLNISDLLVLFVYCPSKAIWQLVFDWRGGDFLCRFIKFGHELSFQPFTAGLVSKTRLRLLISAAWVYSLFFSAKNLFFWTTVTIPHDPYKRTQCTTWPMRLFIEGKFDNFTERIETAAFVVHLTTSFYLPLLVILSCYSVILAHVWRHYKSPEGLLLREAAREANSRGTSNSERRLSQSDTKKTGKTSILERTLSRFRRADPNRNDMVLDSMGNGDAETVYTPLQATATRLGGTPELLAPAVAATTPTPDSRHPSHGTLRMHCPSPTGTARQISSEQRLKLRTLMTTAILITAYIATWLPYQLLAIWPYLHPDSFTAIRRKWLSTVCLFLLTLNSVINPLIYGIYRSEMTKSWRTFKRNMNYAYQYYSCC